MNQAEQAYSITLIPPAVTHDEPYKAVVYAVDRADMWDRIQAVLDRDEAEAPGMWSGWCVQVNGKIDTTIGGK